jgi:GT2 family glycosyltransferase
VVVTWNSAQVLPEMIRTIHAARFGGELRLVVADNASSDDTLGVVERLAPSAVVTQTGRNAGYAAGINAGIREAGPCDAYFVLNADMRLEPDTVQVLYDSMQRTGAGIVVPRLLDESGHVRLSLRNRPSIVRAWAESLLGGGITARRDRLGERVGRPSEYLAPRTADWATGAAMLVSRDCAEAVGEWDESYFLYSEETDFALRAQDAGFTLWYEPRAVAVHFEGDSHRSPALYALLVRNRIRLFRSRRSRFETALYWCGVFVGEALRAAAPTHRAAVSALIGRPGVVAEPEPARELAVAA